MCGDGFLSKADIGEAVEIAEDILGRDVSKAAIAKFVYSATESGLIRFQGLRGELPLGFRPPLVGDIPKGAGLRTLFPVFEYLSVKLSLVRTVKIYLFPFIGYRLHQAAVFAFRWHIFSSLDRWIFWCYNEHGRSARPGGHHTVAVTPFFTRKETLYSFRIHGGRSGAYDFSFALLLFVVTYEALFAFCMLLIAFAALMNRK